MAFLKIDMSLRRLHGGAEGRVAASQLQSPWLDPELGLLFHMFSYMGFLFPYLNDTYMCHLQDIAELYF